MSESGFVHRGVMLDLARLTERHDYYLGLLPQLKEWGYNLLHLHFSDDQGCALKFPSHPELATPHAYSPAEMRAFCEEARKLGIEVVPEVECFGHTRFITRLKRYRHLNEAPDARSLYSGMCVFHPEAQTLLGDILRDTAEIFQPRLIHAGLDEVNFGTHPVSRKLLKKKKKNELFADHVLWCHEVITELGARMAVWGDHYLSDKEEVIVSRTPRDTLIFDWHYNADYNPWTMDFFTERGFEVYGAPAIQRSRNRVLSDRENFSNVRRFSAFAHQRRKKSRGKKGSVTGMVVTVWCPYRYVPGTIEYPLAHSGMLFSTAGPEPLDFALDFTRSFWGLTGAVARQTSEALEALYDMSLNKDEYDRIVFGKVFRRPTDAFSRVDQYAAEKRLPVVDECKRVLKQAIPSARRHAGRLRDLVAAAEYLDTLYQFARAGRTGNPGWRKLQGAIQKSWARTRYCDGPQYEGKSPPRPRDTYNYAQILRDLNRSAGD